MASVLDSILVKELIDIPTTVSIDFATEPVNIADRQDEFSVQVNYNNGNGFVNIAVSLEVSNDGVNYVAMKTSNLVDDFGSHLFDIVGGTGTRFMRINFVVNAGSIDVQRILYSGKRLH